MVLVVLVDFGLVANGTVYRSTTLLVVLLDVAGVIKNQAPAATITTITITIIAINPLFKSFTPLYNQLYVITLLYNPLEFTNAYHLTNLLVKIVTDYRYQANNWTKIAYH